MSAEDDDQTWLDALAGRPQEGAPRAARLEGAMLREALCASRAAEDAPGARAAGPDAAREQALIARAMQEGLIEPADAARAATPGRAHRRSWASPGSRASWRPLLAAAALVGLAVGIAWQLRPAPEGGVVRSDGSRIVRLEAQAPALLQQRLLGELRAAGVEASGYEALGVYGIDADLPQPTPPAVRRVLASYGIEPPADGVLRIEIRERS